MQQRGFTLVETILAAGLVAVALIALFSVLAGASRFAASSGGPNRQTALHVAAETIRLAQNAWKYAPQDAPSGTLATSAPVPVPSGDPTTIPLTVQAILARTGDSAKLRVVVTYPQDGFRSQTGRVVEDAVLQVAAPLPQSTIIASPIPQPSGAP
jgi:type II secretory pathway pseudopilin PulG